MVRTRFFPDLAGPGPFRVDIAAIVLAAAGFLAALAILTHTIAAATIGVIRLVIGLIVAVVTVRRPSPWLTLRNDLTALSLSDGDFEACLAAARRSGRRRGSGDPEAMLDGVTLVLPGRTWRVPGGTNITFRIRESEDHPWRMLTFDRPPSRPETSALGANGGDRVAPAADAPWRLDPSWRQLVALSWVRMQPFVGTVILKPLSRSPRRRRHWEIEYRATKPAGPGRMTSFRLRTTGVYRPASARRAGHDPDAAVGSPTDPTL